jgi:hypothetical protein
VNLAEPGEEGTVNVATGAEKKGWSTPDESWLEKEAIQDGERSFVNVALGRSGEDNFVAGDHDAKDILEKVRCMLSAKASQCQTPSWLKKYPWWPLKHRRRSERGCNPGGQEYFREPSSSAKENTAGEMYPT